MITIELFVHLERVRIFSLVRTMIGAAAIALLLAGCGPKPTETNSQANVNGAPPDYSARVGVAIRTGARTCVSIRNRTLQANASITLVQPASPQSYTEAQISGTSSSACPLTEQVDPTMSSYDLTLPAGAAIPKLSPLIAALGSAAGGRFALDNMNVQADLDANHAGTTFRACGADDGVHLSVWRGAPLIGTRLWTGYYFEDGNPGTLPACDAREIAKVPAAR